MTQMMKSASCCCFQDKWKTFNTLSAKWCIGIQGTHYLKLKLHVTVWSMATAVHIWRLHANSYTSNYVVFLRCCDITTQYQINICHIVITGGHNSLQTIKLNHYQIPALVVACTALLLGDSSQQMHQTEFNSSGPNCDFSLALMTSALQQRHINTEHYVHAVLWIAPLIRQVKTA